MIMARQLLISGEKPTDIFSLCGFGQYSNFYRAFKKYYHMSPMTFLKKMNEECHTTIILTSHDMDDISSVCDELIVIDKGKIILQESMDVILSKFSDFKYLKIKMTLDLVPELCSVKGVVVISQTKSECILKIPRDFVFETLESINKLVDIEDFEISNLSLEEIILQNYFTKKEHN